MGAESLKPLKVFYFLYLLSLGLHIYRAAPDLVRGSFRSIMAAATSSERMKVLLLMLSLFSLTCAATTLIDDDDLKELKDNIQTFKRETQRKRVSLMVDSAFLPDFVDDIGHLMDLLSKSFKSIVQFPPLLNLMQDFKFLIKEGKIYLEQVFRSQDAKIRDNEEKLRQMEKLIMALEEWRS